MQGFNKKERKLLELQLTQCKHPNMAEVHNTHYAKFENKGIKTVGVTDYTNQTE